MKCQCHNDGHHRLEKILLGITGDSWSLAILFTGGNEQNIKQIKWIVVWILCIFIQAKFRDAETIAGVFEIIYILCFQSKNN